MYYPLAYEYLLFYICPLANHLSHRDNRFLISIYVFSHCFLLNVMEASKAFLAVLPFLSHFSSIWTEYEAL